MDGNSTFLVAAVVIFAIAAAVAVYVIKKLSANPLVIAAVITALAGLIAAMPPVINSLNQPRPASIPAPVTSTPFSVQPSPTATEVCSSTPAGTAANDASPSSSGSPAYTRCPGLSKTEADK
jgi:hypothetical protein